MKSLSSFEIEICMPFFVLLNPKVDILKNVHNQTILVNIDFLSGWMENYIDSQTERQKNIWMDEWIENQIDSQTERETKIILMDRKSDRQIENQLNKIDRQRIDACLSCF